MAKKASEYAKTEMKKLEKQLDSFVYGGTGKDTQPIADILNKAYKSMKDYYYKCLQKERGTHESRACSMQRKMESLRK
jgi:hypothetical protein